jgi:Protein of unknown function (DUF2510)
MTSVEAPKAPKGPGPSLRVSLVLIVVGALVAIPTLIAGVVPIARAFTASSRFDAPSTVRLHLGKGTYLVYERTGSNSPFSTDDSVTITPADVTVIGPDGERIEVEGRGDVRETLSDAGDRFVDAVRFTTPEAGEYTVTVNSALPTSVLVARPFTDTIESVIVWFVLSGIGGLILVTGIILLIVGSVRRNRARSAFAYAAPVPPGWHPDPAGSGRWRYWDGYRWTEHVQ